jgi:hypothetical protein
MGTMGIGDIGGPSINIKRKFRWTFRVDFEGSTCKLRSVPDSFVKLAARPNIDIEETEINHLNGKTWIPGKGTWQTVEVTYYDVGTNGNEPLFNWLATIYDYTNPIQLNQASKRSDYAGNGVLKLYDGCGEVMEIWQLQDMWCKAINFGELDYASSEECTIAVTLRYSNVKYQSFCPAFTPKGCCSSC